MHADLSCIHVTCFMNTSLEMSGSRIQSSVISVKQSIFFFLEKAVIGWHCSCVWKHKQVNECLSLSALCSWVHLDSRVFFCKVQLFPICFPRKEKKIHLWGLSLWTQIREHTLQPSHCRQTKILVLLFSVRSFHCLLSFLKPRTNHSLRWSSHTFPWTYLFGF